MADAALNLVVIRSSDVDRSRLFYEAIGLTFAKHRHGAGLEHLASETPGMVFEIYPQADPSQSTAGVRLGFKVEGLDGLLTALAIQHVNIVSPAKESPWGRRAVVSDPDGHRVELVEATRTI